MEQMDLGTKKERAPKLTITTPHVNALLDSKYGGYDSLIAFEVADGTGGAASRWADAVAMHLWPSKDYLLEGFEVKVSRADWLKELKEPNKCEAVKQYCDKWWLVAPADIIKADEIPWDWGWMKVSEKSIRIAKQAPKLKAMPPDRCFMASFTRKINEKYNDSDFKSSIYQKARKEMYDEVGKGYERTITRLNEDIAKYETILREFNEKTGLHLSKYSSGKICASVAILNQFKRDKTGLEVTLERTKGILEKELEGCTEALAELKEIRTNALSSNPQTEENNGI